VGQELQARAWRGAAFGSLVTGLAELAYVFIDYRVHGTWLLPALRALHTAWSFAVMGWLLARRRRLTQEQTELAFAAVVVPFLPLFALAEHAMAASGRLWVPMTGHRLVMLAIGVLAPMGLWVGGGLIIALALEAVVLWYALDLGTLLPDVQWEPWVTLVYGGVAFGMLAWRVRNYRIELKLRQARAEAEALERMARLFLALRDAANTPLQTLELSLALLRRRGGQGSEPLMASMERALARLRALTQRMASADPLVVWRQGEESFDAEDVLRHLEEALLREQVRRRQ
jgi:hypothetical protein